MDLFFDPEILPLEVYPTYMLSMYTKACVKISTAIGFFNLEKIMPNSMIGSWSILIMKCYTDISFKKKDFNFLILYTYLYLKTFNKYALIH